MKHKTCTGDVFYVTLHRDLDICTGVETFRSILSAGSGLWDAATSRRTTRAGLHARNHRRFALVTKHGFDSGFDGRWDLRVLELKRAGEEPAFMHGPRDWNPARVGARGGVDFRTIGLFPGRV